MRAICAFSQERLEGNTGNAVLESPGSRRVQPRGGFNDSSKGWEDALSVKYFPCNPEDVSSIPSTHLKKLEAVSGACH